MGLGPGAKCEARAKSGSKDWSGSLNERLVLGLVARVYVGG